MTDLSVFPIDEFSSLKAEVIYNVAEGFTLHGQDGPWQLGAQPLATAETSWKSTSNTAFPSYYQKYIQHK